MAFWLFLWAFLPLSASAAPDGLDSLLQRIGWQRQDLAIEISPAWPRIPDPARLPGTLRFLPDLLAHPLETYPFVRSLANLALASLSDTAPSGLYRTLYALGVDLRLVGFRGYGANTLTASGDTALPTPTLSGALARLWHLAGQGQTPGSFGSPATAPWQAAADTLAQHLPETLQPLIARYLWDLAEALSWVLLARRNLSPDQIQGVYALHRLWATQPDGQRFYPVLEDAARLLDAHSLAYAALKVAEATGHLAHRLAPQRALLRQVSRCRVSTPWGALVILGPGDDTLALSSALWILDVGGDDRYAGGAGTRPEVPVAVLLDLSGNDRYETSAARAQGTGILGVGLLWDHEGRDVYRAGDEAQGYGLLGYGLLYDRAGNDVYQAGEGAQGCGLWGTGLLVDLSGDDRYRILGNGQADGEYGGLGLLLDLSGDDSYYAEPWSSVYDRGDYHSEYRVNASNAQGFGGGRRGDGSDGHSWAGGFGFLLDAGGNDRYESGNWSLGTGYWFGMGVLLDLGGDDLYRSCYFTQGSGAHFAIGAFFDEAGDDRHPLFETAGAALGFGWDFTQALFVDFQGNDTYEAQRISLGTAEIWSRAFFLDLAGDDTYRVPAGAHAFGSAPPRKTYRQRSRTLPFLSDLKAFALFGDFGGRDSYPADAAARNDTLWFQPPLDKPGRTFYGIGVDRRHRPRFRELDLWQSKPTHEASGG